VKIGRVFPDLLTPLGAAASIEDGLTMTLRRLVTLTGAHAGALAFWPPHRRAVTVATGALAPALRAWLLERVARRAKSSSAGRLAVPGRTRSRGLLLVPLGTASRPVGRLALLGDARRLRRDPLPAAFPRELGTAIEHVWRVYRRTVRMSVVNSIMTLLASTDSLDSVLRGFVDGLAQLVAFDSMSVTRLDRERDDLEVIDVLARAMPGVPRRDSRLPLDDTLSADVMASGTPRRIGDTGEDVPRTARTALETAGYRSAIAVPLLAATGPLGAVIVAATAPRAFDDEDVDIVGELARPLASAVEQRRLLAESRRSAEELAALYATGQLITAELGVRSVLDEITRSVITLVGGTGCSLGLLDPARDAVVHTAVRGFQTEEWRELAIPVGEGIIGACAAAASAIRVDDVRLDPRSARRDIDEREGIRSMLCVPLRVGGAIIGVLSAFSMRPTAFTGHHERLLEMFADQAGSAIANARLFEESERRARETSALLEAGRAVTRSLNVGKTMDVIMEQARAVLGVASCGILRVDPDTGELVSVASLDLPPTLAGRIRVKEGSGITGRAVAERRPVQSRDLFVDERVLYRDLQRETGLRSMLAAPLRMGERAIGALAVFRRDIHDFSPAEEQLLVALADQAAIALANADLYQRLEAMVTERTRELDAEKRFVEVVLETLPLGVFVLDGEFRIIRANRDAGTVLPGGSRLGEPFASLLGTRARAVSAFLAEARDARRVQHVEQEIPAGTANRTVRLTAAPLEAGAGHVVVLAEDVTLAKRLERQMLLTERLTTAGRLASGVAHELNNPLATIAGCAESLIARLPDARMADPEIASDFQQYLSTIEQEAYRCKEITGSLLQFVREPGSRRVPTDLNPVVQKSIELLAHQSRFANARFVTDLAPDLPAATVNEGQVLQVFLGLAANALEAMDGGGTLMVRTRARDDEIEIEFEDEGPGIPHDVLPHIFDPFFTTKPPGQGTGLGLAIAQGIVNDHGGRIEPPPGHGKGATFRVVIPR
jgi:GAF domain-containing protein/nitrogen-specific signal transduction histidine kinase